MNNNQQVITRKKINTGVRKSNYSYFFQVHTGCWKHKLATKFMTHLANITGGYCGSDIQALCSEAVLCCLRRNYPKIDVQGYNVDIKVHELKVNFFIYLFNFVYRIYLFSGRRVRFPRSQSQFGVDDVQKYSYIERVKSNNKTAIESRTRSNFKVYKYTVASFFTRKTQVIFIFIYFFPIIIIVIIIFKLLEDTLHNSFSLS